MNFQNHNSATFSSVATVLTKGYPARQKIFLLELLQKNHEKLGKLALEGKAIWTLLNSLLIINISITNINLITL